MGSGKKRKEVELTLPFRLVGLENIGLYDRWRTARNTFVSTGRVTNMHSDETAWKAWQQCVRKTESKG